MKLKSFIYSAILLLSANCFAQPQLETERVVLNALNKYPVNMKTMQVGSLPSGKQMCQLVIQRFKEQSPNRGVFAFAITPPLSSRYDSTNAYMFITYGQMGGLVSLNRDKGGDFV